MMPEGATDPREPIEREEGEPKPYRPSNGTEGECFMGRWCAHCVLDAYGSAEDEHELSDGPTCDVLGNALAGFQPDEWIYGRDGQPRCTAFQAEPPDPLWGSPFDPDGAMRLLI